ncbi:MAG: MBL fold metallo-hydrolase [Planctomycetes bacterium]|nr:MBL fold metallo-hydrolase [Planctomycetota bacterium]
MEIAWFGHGTVRVFSFGQTILVDPIRANAKLGTTFKPDTEQKATVVLVTSEKADHCEPETVKAAAEMRAHVIAPKSAMKGLLRTRRTDIQWAIAKADETFAIGEHMKVRSVKAREGFGSGVVYILHGSETIVFLGDSLMDKAGWAYLAGDVKPDVIVYPPYLALGDKGQGDAFREWIVSLGSVSCIPVIYHSSPHADPVYFVKQEDIPKSLPPGARLEMLTNRPLVAKETRRMRRRM